MARGNDESRNTDRQVGRPGDLDDDEGYDRMRDEGRPVTRRQRQFDEDYRRQSDAERRGLGGSYI